MKPKKVNVKPKQVTLLLLVIGLVSLTLSLRGATPKTYVQTGVPASAVKTMLVSYDFANGANWCVNDFASDVSNWRIHNDNYNSSLYVNGEILCLSTELGVTQGPHSVVLSRTLNMNLSELPIFSMNISVSKSANYHVRFEGMDSTGAIRQVWWETSPLDDIPGKSKWEMNAVDLAVFSEQATGEVIPTITAVQVILDKTSPQVLGELTLWISSMRFSERNPKIAEFSGNGTFSFGSESFQAVLINVPPQYMPSESWRLVWASVTYRLTSNVSSGYKMIFLSKDNGALIDGPTFLSHEASFADIYKLEALSIQYSHSQQLTFVSALVGNYSIVIFKDAWDGTGFSTFALDSIEIASSKVLGGGG
jgi:hypothetical protein